MKLLPVSLVVFYRTAVDASFEVWTQIRTDDGPYQGLLEFPGGKIEATELPLDAAVREVQEEVGITIDPNLGKKMGVYPSFSSQKTILLHVFLFPDTPLLKGKGTWLKIEQNALSSNYKGKIPVPNHEIIDDLYHSLYS